VSMEGDSDYWERIFLCRENATPTFLQPTLDLVMVAGKSRHLMGVISARKELSPQTAALLVRSFSSLELEKATPSLLLNHLSLDARETFVAGSCDTDHVAMVNEGVTGSEQVDLSSPGSGISGTGNPSRQPLSPSPNESSHDDESKRNAHYDALVRTYMDHLQEMGVVDHEPLGGEGLATAAVEGVVDSPRRSLLGPLRVLLQDQIHSLFRQHYKKVGLASSERLPHLRPPLVMKEKCVCGVC